MPGSRPTFRSLVAAVLIAGSAAAASAQTAQICLSTQLRTAGAVCLGLSRCYAKAIKRSAPYVDADCVAARSSRLTIKFAGVESISNCLVEPAGTSTFNTISAPMDALWGSVKPNNTKCGPWKMGALGRACRQYLNCYSVAAAGSAVVDPACLAAAHVRLDTAFDGFDGSGACDVTKDVLTLEPQITAIVDSVETLLRGSGTTTTSTTTTTTSPTTTTLAPGACLDNGAFDPCTAYVSNPACTSCVDSATGPDADVAKTLCGAAAPTCSDSYYNAACGYAINTSTGCGPVCCP